MIIAVQRGLSSIKERLEEKGYKTVYADEYNHPADIYIKTGYSTGGFSSVLTQAQSAPAASVFTNGHMLGHGHALPFSGALEINATEKCFDEIEAEISRQRLRIKSFY